MGLEGPAGSQRIIGVELQIEEARIDHRNGSYRIRAALMLI
jgi:hypothetical protein